MNETVGVRELRQNLSRYLRRVAEGDRFTVTDHNVPVAELTPLAEKQTEWDRVLAAVGGKKGRGRLTELPPPPRLPGNVTLSEILEETRAERL